MGKWAHLIGQYPEKKEATIAAKEAFSHLGVKQLEVELASLTRDKGVLEQRLSRLKSRIAGCEEVLLEHWEKDKTTQARRDDIGTLSRNDDVFARIKNLTEFKEWADRHNLGNLVEEKVNATSLTSTVKQLMEDGEPLPEGISIFTKSRIKVTQPKGVKHE